MSPGQMIEQLAATAYADGVDPLRFTTAVLEVIVEECFELDCHDPKTRLLARKIIAALLDCGWAMPGQKGQP
jgi:hypothetical protein